MNVFGNEKNRDKVRLRVRRRERQITLGITAKKRENESLKNVLKLTTKTDERIKKYTKESHKNVWRSSTKEGKPGITAKTHLLETRFRVQFLDVVVAKTTKTSKFKQSCKRRGTVNKVTWTSRWVRRPLYTSLRLKFEVLIITSQEFAPQVHVTSFNVSSLTVSPLLTLLCLVRLKLLLLFFPLFFSSCCFCGFWSFRRRTCRRSSR